MDGPTLLDGLAPIAEQLLERHLAATHDWLPHDVVPWGRATGAPATAVPGVREALVLNVLTEDALPYFTTGLYRQFGEASPWSDWIRRWTAEEARHGQALHDYASVAGVVDAADLERRRLEYLSTASVPSAPSVADACVYLALQELATRIAHANTARLLPDDAGRRLVARIAADEHLHHVFYRDLVGAALDLAPSPTVLAIDRQVRHFTMPGREIADFTALARTVADAGIFSTSIYVEQVAVPLAMGAWRIGDLVLADEPARRARARLLRFIERLASIAPRMRGGVTTVASGDAGARSGSSSRR